MSRDFLSFLVDETLKLQESGEAQLSSLELKLSDYSLSFLKGEFIPQSQVLRFRTDFGNIDVPINWSVFAINKSGTSETILSEDNDHDHFFKVLKTVWNPGLSKMLITHADGFCYLVGLRAGEDHHVHDILNPQEWLKAG